MTLRIITVGGVREGWAKEGCQFYLSRLRHYGVIEIAEVRDSRGALPDQRVLKEEGERILSRLTPQDWPTALDISGQVLDSVQFARWLGNRLQDSRFHPAFILGGPLGFSDEVRKACRERLSLSAMTLPHDLCRLVFLEQLYRAHTILRGEPYHK